MCVCVWVSSWPPIEKNKCHLDAIWDAEPRRRWWWSAAAAAVGTNSDSFSFSSFLYICGRYQIVKSFFSFRCSYTRFPLDRARSSSLRRFSYLIVEKNERPHCYPHTEWAVVVVDQNPGMFLSSSILNGLWM